MNDKTLGLVFNLVKVLLIVIGIILFFMIMNGGSEETGYNESAISGSITLVIAMMVISAVVAVLFGVLKVVLNPKGSLRTLIGLGAFALMAIFAYITATSELMTKWTLKDPEGNMFNESTSWSSDFSLRLLYIVGLVTIGAILFAEVSKMMKKYFSK